MNTSKRGNINIFLSIIMVALFSVAFLLVYSAREQALFSCADGVFNIAGDSLLSEYDHYIYEDYGLFLLKETDKSLTSKFKAYAGYTLNNLDRVNLSDISVSSGRFSTVNITPVKDQIVEYMKSPAGIRRCHINSNEADGDNGSNLAHSNGDAGRFLRHEPTIVSLPSRSLPDKSIIASAGELADNLSNPESIFREGSQKYMLGSYALGVFNCDITEQNEDHFFNREVEYLICGELSDDKNKRQTDLALIALRTGLNLQHIYTDKEKFAAVEAASQVITPGVLGTVTQLGISTAWATAEATNDVKLLHNGYGVPLVKTKASWAIDLDALIDGYDAEKGFIVPTSTSGRHYKDYLRILLFVKDDNLLTSRIMDLIQINMRKSYDEDFLIQECATGITINATVQGRRFSYDKIY